MFIHSNDLIDALSIPNVGMPGDRDNAYSGQKTYIYVERIISEPARSLKIICPFISPHYARMLVKASQKKEVSIITSNSKISAEAVKILMKDRIFRYASLIAYFAVLALALALFGLYLAEAIVLPILLVITSIAIGRYLKPGRKRIRIKVGGERFIHEKVYISDKHAITGSANLTYKGLHSNVEHIEVIEEDDRIAQLNRHFNELWRSI